MSGKKIKINKNLSGVPPRQHISNSVQSIYVQLDKEKHCAVLLQQLKQTRTNQKSTCVAWRDPQWHPPSNAKASRMHWKKMSSLCSQCGKRGIAAALK